MKVDNQFDAGDLDLGHGLLSIGLVKSSIPN